MRSLLIILLFGLSLQSYAQLDTMPARYDVTHIESMAVNDLLLYKGQPYTGVAFIRQITGKIKEEYTFVRGRKSGEAIFYHTNGKVYAKGNYDGHKQVGEWRVYYPDGKLMQITPYVDGFRNGQVTSYVQPNGFKYVTTYKDGKEQGEFMMTDSTGVVVAKGEYDRGFKSGPWLEYNLDKDTSYEKYYKTYQEKVESMPALVGWKDLEETENRLFYENIPYTGRRIQRKDGKIGEIITNEMILEDGYVKSYKNWHNNGQLFFEAFYDKGLAVGEWIYYREDGQLQRKDIYVNGKLEGESISYNPDGTKQKHFHYKEDMKHGLCVSYKYGRGNKKENERNYFRDTLHGESKDYFDSGRISARNHYKMGVQDGAQYLFSDEGDTISAQIFLDGRLLIEDAKFINGQKKYEFSYTIDGLQGEFKSYYQSGQLKEVGQYDKHQKVGEWKYFFEGDTSLYVREFYQFGLSESNIGPKGAQFFDIPANDDFQGFVKKLNKIKTSGKPKSLKSVLHTEVLYKSGPKEAERTLTQDDFIALFDEKGLSNLVNQITLTGLKKTEGYSDKIAGVSEMYSNYGFKSDFWEEKFLKGKLALGLPSIPLYASPDKSQETIGELVMLGPNQNSICDWSSKGDDCYYRIQYLNETAFFADSEFIAANNRLTVLLAEINGSYKIVGLILNQ